MILTRTDVGSQGAFGELQVGRGLTLVTLEHTHSKDGATWEARVPKGTWTCIRDLHQCEDGIPFETFEVCVINFNPSPKHSDVFSPTRKRILFHGGQLPLDSTGCIQLGKLIGDLGGRRSLLESKIAFDTFMRVLDGTQYFQLTVQ